MRLLARFLPLVVLLGAAPRAEFKLEAVLPDSTLLFAELPSAATFREGFKKTRLYRFFQDEEVRAFFEEALEAGLRDIDGFRRELEAETGVALDRAWELADGQAALALTSIKPPTVLLTVECSGKRDVLLKLAAYARKAHDARSDRKAETWKLGEAEALSGRLPGGLPLNLAIVGDVLAIATSREALQALDAGRRQPPARPLGASSVFLKAREKSQAKDAFFYADVAGFVKGVQENLGPQERRAVAALGVDGFTFAAAGIALRETHVTERAFLGAGPERKGLAKFLSLKGAAPGFEAAPADALQFLSLSIDVAELYDTVLEIAQEADPPGAARLRDAIADFEQEAGLTLKGDLFPALGRGVSTYSAFPQDGLLPDGVSVFEIRDAARFDACLDAALRNLEATLGEVPFRGASIRFFRFKEPPLDDPARLLLSSLYFLREDGRVTVSAPLMGGLGGVNALKRHVLRRDQPRLSAAPAVRDWLGGRTGDASLVYYLDLERGFTALYNTVAPFALVFGDGLRDSGLDLMKLPLGETLGKHLSQIVHCVRVE
ncbi:MAG TPA: hypothetical protein VEJ18_03185, partial [Planctomycetota bacterium]|nr:hypothetical protein [Planctomycetota bacterium]